MHQAEVTVKHQTEARTAVSFLHSATFSPDYKQRYLSEKV